MKKVLVFGVFDRLHPGHLHFLEQARALGDELVVLVARDSIVELLKNKTPRENEMARVRGIKGVKNVSQVKLGDSELGTYTVLKEERPDLIALGYDQDGLRADLLKRMEEGSLPQIPLVTLVAHMPEQFKSSLL